MTSHVQEIKWAVTAFFTACTALWGWMGWLVLLWMGCLILDFVTGSMAAASEGAWSSKAARKGIWHKLGCMVAVMVAAAGDLLLGLVTANLPDFPLAYATVLCPTVLVWYVIAELGSVMENAVRLGAPIPAFLKKALQLGKPED